MGPGSGSAVSRPLNRAREARLLEARVPDLEDADYEVTSPSSHDYNCVAWALDDCTRWWWPAPVGGYYWPQHLPVLPGVAAFTAPFRECGYAESETADLEPGVQKIAIYGDARGEPTHVARQLPSGWWASKLGVAADIEHAALQSIEGGLFGSVLLVMARVRAS